MSTLRHYQGAGKRYVGSGSITISALAAGAEEDLTISDSNAEVTDVVCVSLANANMETGLGVIGAWVSAAGTIKIRFSNFSGGALTGGAATVYYSLEKTV